MRVYRALSDSNPSDLNPDVHPAAFRCGETGQVLCGTGGSVSTIAHACTECVPVAILNNRQVAESNAEPADLSGYTRAKQELVAPPFAPAHEQVATSCPKIIEITMETTERLMLVYEDAGASVGA